MIVRIIGRMSYRSLADRGGHARVLLLSDQSDKVVAAQGLVHKLVFVSLCRLCGARAVD